MLALVYVLSMHTLAAANLSPHQRDCSKYGDADRAWIAEVGHWFESQTSPSTGLVRSYEETANQEMSQQAAIYDLSIAAILFAETCMTDRAVAVLDSLERMWVGLGLPNLVTTTFPSAGLETVVHTGPNAWVGLSAYRLYRNAHHHRHLEFATAIADWIVNGHPQLRQPGKAGVPWVEFGIDKEMIRTPAMGPKAAFGADGVVYPWNRIVSTEHALDVFSLLSQLIEDTATSEIRKAAYRLALADVANYLRVASTRPECLDILGMNRRPADSIKVCLMTGGAVEGTKMKWSSDLNASDVYYWWVSAIPEDYFSGNRVPRHQEILQAANARFDQEVDVRTRRGVVPVYGTDYFTCTSSSGSRTCDANRNVTCRLLHPGACHPPIESNEGEVSPPSESRSTQLGNGGVLQGPVPDEGTRAESTSCEPQHEDLHRPREFFRRRPLVSVEWTGEAILANGLLSKPGTPFAEQRDRLLAGMKNLELRENGSLSYPYASEPCTCVFSGGWLTPAARKGQGAEGLVGSVAGTAWMAFGRLGINPFQYASKVGGEEGVPFVDLPPPPASAACALPDNAPEAPVETKTSIPEDCPRNASICVSPDTLIGASVDTLLAAAWACLKYAEKSPAEGPPGNQALTRAKILAETVLQTTSANLHSIPVENGVKLFVLAESEQQRRTSHAELGCSFDDFALNNAATALLLKAKVDRMAGGDGCTDARMIAERLPDACLYSPRTVVGEPFDRFGRQPGSAWEVLGDPPRLGENGFHVPLLEVVRRDFPDCLPSSPTDSSSARLGTWILRAPLLVEGESHAFRDGNLFFDDRHKGIYVFQGEARAGLDWSLQVGGLVLSLPIYAYARVIDATGAEPLDQVLWLRNHALGGGAELRLALKERPIWLRELDIRASFRAGHIGYQTDRAAGTSDRELRAALSGWTYLYLPVRQRHGLWAEFGLAGYGGRLTEWTVAQSSLWISSATMVGFRYLHLIEPYFLAKLIANPLQHTDWDNNLRIGAGGRIPILHYTGGPTRQITLRVDGYWQRTVAYWSRVDYVPSFRPLNDFRISTDLWFGWQ